MLMTISGVQHFIIDDTNYVQFQPDNTGVVPAQHGGGEARYCSATPRDYTKQVYGSVGTIDPLMPTIDMQEWPERIAERLAKKQRNKDLWAAEINRVLDQDGLNYCHAYSGIMGLLFSRARAGLPFVELSAGSIGGPITNYRNEGAWIGDDLKQMLTVGAASTEFVPMDAVSKSRWKPGALENCKLHKAEEIWELRSRDYVQQVSAMLAGFGLCVGLNYWGHAVFDVDPVDLHPGAKVIDLDRFGTEFLNSWNTTFGENGFATRTGSKKFADEAYVIRTATLSEQ